MKPIVQDRFGGSEAPENEQGNCLAAAIASVFELALGDVPDFAGHIENFAWYGILQSWLAKRNMCLFPVTVGNGHPEGSIILAACKSTTLKDPDDGHVIVMQDGKQIHDPNPNAAKTGVEQLWTFAVLDPSKGAIREPEGGSDARE